MELEELDEELQELECVAAKGPISRRAFLESCSTACPARSPPLGPQTNAHEENNNLKENISPTLSKKKRRLSSSDYWSALLLTKGGPTDTGARDLAAEKEEIMLTTTATTTDAEWCCYVQRKRSDGQDIRRKDKEELNRAEPVSPRFCTPMKIDSINPIGSSKKNLVERRRWIAEQVINNMCGFWIEATDLPLSNRPNFADWTRLAELLTSALTATESAPLSFSAFQSWHSFGWTLLHEIFERLQQSHHSSMLIVTRVCGSLLFLFRMIPDSVCHLFPLPESGDSDDATTPEYAATRRMLFPGLPTTLGPLIWFMYKVFLPSPQTTNNDNAGHVPFFADRECPLCVNSTAEPNNDQFMDSIEAFLDLVAAAAEVLQQYVYSPRFLQASTDRNSLFFQEVKGTTSGCSKAIEPIVALIHHLALPFLCLRGVDRILYLPFERDLDSLVSKSNDRIVRCHHELLKAAARIIRCLGQGMYNSPIASYVLSVMQGPFEKLHRDPCRPNVDVPSVELSLFLFVQALLLSSTTILEPSLLPSLKSVSDKAKLEWRRLGLELAFSVADCVPLQSDDLGRCWWTFLPGSSPRELHRAWGVLWEPDNKYLLCGMHSCPSGYVRETKSVVFRVPPPLAIHILSDDFLLTGGQTLLERALLTIRGWISAASSGSSEDSRLATWASRRFVLGVRFYLTGSLHLRLQEKLGIKHDEVESSKMEETLDQILQMESVVRTDLSSVIAFALMSR